MARIAMPCRRPAETCYPRNGLDVGLAVQTEWRPSSHGERQDVAAKAFPRITPVTHFRGPDITA
jgi:hypothetical protein